MKLNLNFTKYIGKTLLKDWWPVVLGHMRDIQNAVNTNDTALTTEVSDRKAADTALGGRIDTEISDRKSAVSGEASARQSADTALGSRIDGKADKTHSHKKSDIIDFSHKHGKSDITDFPTTMPPSAGSVTMNALASDVTAAIEGATGLGALGELTTAVYGAKTALIELEEFNLVFECQQSVGGDTWKCLGFDQIYDNATVNGEPLTRAASPATELEIIKNYVHSDGFADIVMCIGIPDDGEKPYTLEGFDESIVNSGSLSHAPTDYPKVIEVTDSVIKVAIGVLFMPEHPDGNEYVTVSGGSVAAAGLDGDIANDKLATTDKSSILAAVNELAGKCDAAEDLKNEVDGLGSRLNTHKHTKADITDFPETMPPDEHNHTTADITDFPETMEPTDASVTMEKLSSDVTAAIAKGGSGVDSLTAQLAALKADVEYLKDNVIYRMDGVE